MEEESRVGRRDNMYLHAKRTMHVCKHHKFYTSYISTHACMSIHACPHTVLYIDMHTLLCGSAVNTYTCTSTCSVCTDLPLLCFLSTQLHVCQYSLSY